MGTEVFHGRNGNSGNSVVVSIGAHSHPGKRSCSGEIASLLLYLNFYLIFLEFNQYLYNVGSACC